jgi:hypothetical protein
MRRPRLLREGTLAATIAACALAGCAAGVGAETDPQFEVAGPSFAGTVQPLFDLACNCHQTEPVLMAPFSLKPAEAYANLVDRPAMQLASMLLVKPGSLNESYLWHKVNGTQIEVGGTGQIMPSTIPLDAGQLGVIERWIASGAAP